MIGSTLLPGLLDRLPILDYAAGGFCIHSCGDVFEDPAPHNHPEPLASVEWLLGLGFTELFVAVARFWTRRTERRAQAVADTRMTGKERERERRRVAPIACPLERRFRSCREPS